MLVDSTLVFVKFYSRALFYSMFPEELPNSYNNSYYNLDKLVFNRS